MNGSMDIAKKLANLAFLFNKKLIRPIIHQSNSELSSLQLHVLSILKDKNVATMTMLANEMRMPKTQMTHIVEKLASQSIVQREFDPNDRRIIKISLTEAGFALLNSIEGRIVQAVADKLNLMDDKELLVLEVTATQLAEILKDLP